MHGLSQAILAQVRQIPPGQVATYGQIAKRVATGPRQVGQALRRLSASQAAALPWHRVVNAQGKVSERRDRRDGDLGECQDIQRLRLEAEGVEFDNGGKIDLQRFPWKAAS